MTFPRSGPYIGIEPVGDVPDIAGCGLGLILSGRLLSGLFCDSLRLSGLLCFRCCALRSGLCGRGRLRSLRGLCLLLKLRSGLRLRRCGLLLLLSSLPFFAFQTSAGCGFLFALSRFCTSEKGTTTPALDADAAGALSESIAQAAGNASPAIRAPMGASRNFFNFISVFLLSVPVCKGPHREYRSPHVEHRPVRRD